MQILTVPLVKILFIVLICFLASFLSNFFQLLFNDNVCSEFNNVLFQFIPIGASNLKYNKRLYGVTKLCGLCAGQGANKCARNSRELYYGYEGAFKCLKDGVGDVAFIKQSILTSLSPMEQAKYKLLCPPWQNTNTVAGWSVFEFVNIS